MGHQRSLIFQRQIHKINTKYGNIFLESDWWLLMLFSYTMKIRNIYGACFLFSVHCNSCLRLKRRCTPFHGNPSSHEVVS